MNRYWILLAVAACGETAALIARTLLEQPKGHDDLVIVVSIIVFFSFLTTLYLLLLILHFVLPSRHYRADASHFKKFARLFKFLAVAFSFGWPALYFAHLGSHSGYYWSLAAQSAILTVTFIIWARYDYRESGGRFVIWFAIDVLAAGISAYTCACYASGGMGVSWPWLKYALHVTDGPSFWITLKDALNPILLVAIEFHRRWEQRDHEVSYQYRYLSYLQQTRLKKAGPRSNHQLVLQNSRLLEIELPKFGVSERPKKILDFGCGDGRRGYECIEFLRQILPSLLPDIGSGGIDITAYDPDTKWRQHLLYADGRLPSDRWHFVSNAPTSFSAFDIILASHVTYFSDALSNLEHQFVHTARPGALLLVRGFASSSFFFPLSLALENTETAWWIENLRKQFSLSLDTGQTKIVYTASVPQNVELTHVDTEQVIASG